MITVDRNVIYILKFKLVDKKIGKSLEEVDENQYLFFNLLMIMLKHLSNKYSELYLFFTCHSN